MKIKPIKKTKAKPISWWKAKADKVFSDFIRQRDGGKCVTCGCIKEWKYQQCGHFHERNITPLRYNEKNCNCQCYACNVLKKGNYAVYSTFMLKRYGQDILYELDEIRKKYKVGTEKYGIDFYKKIVEIYG